MVVCLDQEEHRHLSLVAGPWSPWFWKQPGEGARPRDGFYLSKPVVSYHPCIHLYKEMHSLLLSCVHYMCVAARATAHMWKSVLLGSHCPPSTLRVVWGLDSGHKVDMVSTFTLWAVLLAPFVNLKCSKFGTNLNLTNFFLYKMKIKFLTPWERAWVTYQRIKKNHGSNRVLLKCKVHKLNLKSILKIIHARHVLGRGLWQPTGDWHPGMWTPSLPSAFFPLPGVYDTSPQKSPVYVCRQNLVFTSLSHIDIKYTRQVKSWTKLHSCSASL